MMLLFLIILFFCLLRSYYKKKVLGPQPSSCFWSLPIIGHAHYMLFANNPLKFWNGMKKAIYHSLGNDGVAIFDLGPARANIITDPADCRKISNELLKKPYIYKFSKPWLEVGLVTAEPPQWKSYRNLYLAAFSQRNLNIELYNKYSKILVEKMAPHVGTGEFSPEHHLKIHNLEVTLEYMFGKTNEDMTETNVLYSHTIDQLFDSFALRFFSPLLHIPFFYRRSKLKSKVDNLMETAKTITMKRIENRRNERKRLKDNRNASDQDSIAYIDVLLDINERDDAVTDNDIRDHAETMLIASFDTTTRTMVFMSAVIGSYPEVQKKIYKELQEVLGDNERDLNKEDLSKLVYLEAVIKETLRLYPPVPVIARAGTSEIKLRNFTLPKGSISGICLYGMHRHSVWGADAEQFRPERWLEPGGTPEHAFAGFSLGKRNCAGKLFGMALLKTTFAHLLKRYLFISDISRMVLMYNSFLIPVSGHEIEIKTRTKS